MVIAEDASLSAYESAPTQDDVVERDGKLWLPITLAKRGFLLPVVNVAPVGQDPVAIGYLMPDALKNPNLTIAASRAMRWLLEKSGADHVIMPPSAKSEWFIGQSVSNMYPAPKLIRLPGGTDYDEVVRRSKPGSVVTYTPVTGVQKHIGVPHDIDELAANFFGQKVVFADDVWTTGATLSAMEAAMNPYLGGQRYQKVVLAREAVADVNYPPHMGPLTMAAIAIPEMIGTGFPLEMMTHISEKDMQPGIPAAIDL